MFTTKKLYNFNELLNLNKTDEILIKIREKLIYLLALCFKMFEMKCPIRSYIKWESNRTHFRMSKIIETKTFIRYHRHI